MSSDEEFFDISIGGDALEQLQTAAEVLEVDSLDPIIPIMVGIFSGIVKKYGEDESFRDLCLIDPDTMKAIKLCDIEEVRVKAKMLELGGDV